MLIKSGNKVDCAFNVNKNLDDYLVKLGVKQYNIPFSRNPFGIGNIKAFQELIDIQKRNEYDIVHVHTPIAALYGRLLKLKFKNIKTIYTAHG
ncbi:glycosyltransferase, partial [Clostridioides difficile]|uniref:glycosyltransferase n=2 Tax=Clostridia TaxID=186801 RepID=UPI002E8DE9DB